MAAKNVGKIAIRAIPDVQGFRAELRRKLAALKNVDVEVKVRLHKDSLAGARGQIKALSDNIDLNVRLKKLDTDAVLARRQFRDKLEKVLADTPVHVQVNLDLQEARLATIKRRVEAMVKDLEGKNINIRTTLDEASLDRTKRAVEEAIGPDMFDRLHERQMQAVREKLKAANDSLNTWLRRQNLATQLAVEIPRHMMERAEHTLRDFHSKWNGKKITMETNVNALLSSQLLRWVTRPRFIDLYLRVNKQSLASVTATLAALSGARLIGNIGEDYWEFFRDLDKNLPSISMMTVGIVGLTGALFGAVSSIVSFGSGLTQILPLFLTLPGLIMGTVAALGVLVVAWRDVGTELEPLKDDMEELGDIMSSSYWSEARQPIIDLITNLMPQMRRAFAGVGRAIGGFTGAMADAFAQEFAGGRFESIFSTMEEGFRILQGGAGGFAGAIVNMAQIAGRYFPRLSRWLVRVFDRFDNWLTDISTDGRLDAWMNRGIDSLYALWDGLMAGGQILRGLWTAAEDAGATGMFGFRDQMQEWERLINSPSSQRALTDWFAGGRDAAEGLGDAIEHIFRGLKETSPIVREVFGTAGDAMADLGALIGDILGNDDFMQGLDDMLAGIEDAFENLRPSMEPLGSFLGTAGDFIGGLAESISGPLGAAIETVMPRLENFLRDLQPLADGLGDALEDLLTDENFAGVLDNLEGAIGDLLDTMTGTLPTIRDLLSEILELVNRLSDILSWLGPLLQGIWVGLAGILLLFSQAIDGLNRFLTYAGPVLAYAVQWLGNVIQAFWESLITWDWDSFGSRLEDINLTFGPIFEGLYEEATTASEESARRFQERWNELNDEAGTIDNPLTGLDESAYNTAAEAAEAARRGWTGGGGEFNATGQETGAALTQGFGVGGLNGMYPQSLNLAARMNESVKSATSDANTWLSPAGLALVQGLSGAAVNSLGLITGSAEGMKQAAKSGLGDASTALSPEGRQMVEGMKAAMDIQRKYVTYSAEAIRATIIKSLGGLNSAGSKVGQDLGDGLIGGIRSKIGQIATAAANAVHAATSAAKKAAQTASPSRLWRREIGAQLTAGGALGIEDNAHLMARAAARAIPTPEMSFLGGAFGASQGTGSPLVGELTFVTSGDVRADVQEVMWELNRLQMGGR